VFGRHGLWPSLSNPDLSTVVQRYVKDLNAVVGVAALMYESSFTTSNDCGSQLDNYENPICQSQKSFYPFSLQSELQFGCRGGVVVGRLLDL